MLKIFKNQKFQEAKYNILQQILKHQNVIDVGMNIARSVSNFAQSNSPLSFVEGGVGAFNSAIKAMSSDSDSFFSVDNGWEKLATSNYQQVLYDILSSGLEDFPSQPFKAVYESDKATIYTLPIGQVGKNKAAMFYRAVENNKNDILQTILKKKMGTGGARIFSIVEKNTTSTTGYPSLKFDLVMEDSIAMPSKTADDLSAYLKRYFDKNINRSIILNGLPGVGKSAMAHNIFNKLEINTLKFRYSKATHASMMSAIPVLIDTFQVGGVFLDDFDYASETTNLLEFLEWLHRHCKLVIGITNSLKPFAPALLRPSRIDEIKTIVGLDEEVVKLALGDLYKIYSEKVNGWPIAFINELVIRIRTNPDGDPNEYVEELKKRVGMQTKKMKEDG